MDDLQLLRQYVKDGSQDAFAAIVRRHVDLVYATARRLVGDEHLAQDVAQAAFAVLAQKAKQVEPRRLAGWLVNATRLAANEARRSKLCREKHEWRAAQMRSSKRSEETPADEPTLEQLTPLLDEALCRLGEADRTAVAMRFLQGKSFADVATAMGSSEEAARKRVERAVEKLRSTFMKKGLAPSVGGLMVVLAAHQAQAAPAGLATAISGTAASGGAATGAVLAKGAIKMMALAKLKVAMVVLGALVAVTGAGLTAQMQLSPATVPSQPSGGNGMTTQVHEVTDLVWSGASPSRSEPDLTTTVAGGRGSGGPSRDQEMKELERLICETIGWGTWEGQGAGRGTIRANPEPAQFVITQTPAVQRAIATLLEKMKAAAALQIHVETRLASVDPARMPADLAELMNGPRSTENPGTLSSEQARELFAISDSVVAAPRITIFNGGTAYVNVSTDRNYVSGLKLSEKGYDPVVKTVTDYGVWQEVGAAVLPDGRRVALHIASRETRLLQLELLRFRSGTKPELSLQGPRRTELAMDVQAIVPDREYCVIGRSTMVTEDKAKPGVQQKRMAYLLVKPTIIGQPETTASVSNQTPATAPAAAGASDLVLQVYGIADLTAVDRSPRRIVRGEFEKAKEMAASAEERNRSLARSLCEAIRTGVAPQSWREAGGPGVIRLSPATTELVVVQTPANHALVAQKLAELREGRDREICVNVDSVTVDADKIPPAFRKITDLQRQSLRVPPDLWPDESQCQELVKLATDHRSAEVRLVNGGYAELRGCLVTPYVAPVRPTTRASETFYEAEVEGSDDGITLQVQATATLDGSGVDLKMLPTVKRLLGMEQYAFTPKGTQDQITVQQPAELTVCPLIEWVAPNGKTMLWEIADLAEPKAAANETKGTAKQTMFTLFRATILQ